MISEKQLLANRSNCLKSTGPRTLQGKRTVSRNAVLHGLLSNSDETLIKGENQDEFDSFRQNLRDDLMPSGQLETLLVERITGFFWKLKRTGRMEKGLLDILCRPQTSDETGTKASLPFRMMVTKTYASPLQDPEFQEFMKLKQQQAAAVGLQLPQDKVLDKDTFGHDRQPSDSCEQTPAISHPPQADEKSSILCQPASIVNGTALPSETLGHAVSRDFKDGRLLERLLTYEGRIERSLYKALAELQKFQFIRKRNDAIDVEADLEKTEVAADCLSDDPMHPCGIEVVVDRQNETIDVEAEDGEKPNKAISNVDEAPVVSKPVLSSVERAEPSSVGVPQLTSQTEKTNEAISNVDDASSVVLEDNASTCLTRNHPPKPLAEGGVDNCICTLHAVRRSTCGCLG